VFVASFRGQTRRAIIAYHDIVTHVVNLAFSNSKWQWHTVIDHCDRVWYAYFFRDTDEQFGFSIVTNSGDLE